MHTCARPGSSTHRQWTHIYIDTYTVIARYRGCRLAVTCTWEQLYPSLNIYWLGFAPRQLEDGWTWRLDIGRTAGQYSSHQVWYMHVDEQWQTSNGWRQTRQLEMSPWEVISGWFEHYVIICVHSYTINVIVFTSLYLRRRIFKKKANGNVQ
jgi:hypothetical protein